VEKVAWQMVHFVTPQKLFPEFDTFEFNSFLKINNKESSNSYTLFIIIGSASGGFVILLSVLLTMILLLRKRKISRELMQTGAFSSSGSILKNIFIFEICK